MLEHLPDSAVSLASVWEDEEDCEAVRVLLLWGTSCTLASGSSHAVKEGEASMGTRLQWFCRVCFKKQIWSHFKVSNSLIETTKNSVVSNFELMTPHKKWGGGWRGKELAARVVIETWNRTLSWPCLRLFRIRLVRKGLVIQVLQYWSVFIYKSVCEMFD